MKTQDENAKKKNYTSIPNNVVYSQSNNDIEGHGFIMLDYGFTGYEF